MRPAHAPLRGERRECPPMGLQLLHHGWAHSPIGKVQRVPASRGFTCSCMQWYTGRCSKRHVLWWLPVGALQGEGCLACEARPACLQDMPGSRIKCTSHFSLLPPKWSCRLRSGSPLLPPPPPGCGGALPQAQRERAGLCAHLERIPVVHRHVPRSVQHSHARVAQPAQAQAPTGESVCVFAPEALPRQHLLRTAPAVPPSGKFRTANQPGQRPCEQS